MRQSILSFISKQINTMANKYLFVALAMCLGLQLSAQTGGHKQIAKTPNLKPVPYLKVQALPESVVPELTDAPAMIAGDRNPEEIAGTTRWDAQTYSSIASRVYYKPNGEPAITWTHAIDPTNAFPERGTAYTTRSNGAWSPVNNRLESGTNRTGFPSASILSDGTEVIVSHNTAVTPYKLMFLRRAAGQTAWTESFLEGPAGIGCLWPHLVVGGPDGKTIHIIAITTPTGNNGTVYQGVNGHILYWRSLDGGLTWDKKATIIPGLDNSKYTIHAADEYTLDANGSTVAICPTPAWNDVIVFKSFDNGDSWENVLVRDFPDALENYAGADGDSYTLADVGTPDPDAPDSLAVFNPDGSASLLVDDAGEVHLFFGRMYYVDVDVAAGSSYYPGINGLIHWKESYGADNFQVITGALDYDGDGQLNLSNGNEIAPYYVSLSSMPSSGIASDGTIYMAYSALHELYPSGNDNMQFYRHVYIMKSADNGDSWGDPLDVVDNPYISDSSLIPFVENVYPMMPRHVASNVGIAYQQDYDAGIHLLGPTADGNHPYVDNTILWVEMNPNEVPGFVSTFSPAKPSLEMSISPNPASQVTNLTLNLDRSDKLNIEVFDLLGGRVLQQTMNASAGRQVLTLHLDQLHTGTYTVRVSQGAQFGISKLIIAQ